MENSNYKWHVIGILGIFLISYLPSMIHPKQNDDNFKYYLQGYLDSADNFPNMDYKLQKMMAEEDYKKLILIDE